MKKVFGIMAVAAMMFVGYSTQEKNELSYVLLSNIEALSVGTENDKGCDLHLTSICETQHNDHYFYRNR